MSDTERPRRSRRQAPTASLELEEMVRDGQIDTLVVAITDMQGRLMGKRVQGQAFLDGVIDHGAHFCTYLLGTDMEMNTPEGFKLMNWETGYGDWIAEPVWDTAARPALAARRRRWSSPTRSTRRPARRSRSRRGRSSSARSTRAAKAGYALKAGSEFEFYVLKDSWEEPGRARLAGPRSRSGTTTRTTTSSRRPRPSRSTACCATR